MEHIIRLNRMLPEAYFEALSSPFTNYLSGLYALSALALIAGIALSITRRDSRTWLYLLSPAASHAFVTVSSVAHGALRGSASYTVGYAFGLLQLCFLAYLVHRLEGGRLGAVLLSLFCLSYAALAGLRATVELIGWSI